MYRHAGDEDSDQLLRMIAKDAMYCHAGDEDSDQLLRMIAKDAMYRHAGDEDSDQLLRLIRIFPGRISNSQGCNVQSCGRRRL